MPVSPLGNVIYVNQNMQVASQTQAQHQGKMDFQTALNIQQFQDKEKIVEEVRPLEENQAIDPDKEHEKDQEEQERERTEFDEKDDDSEETPKESAHILDIKI